MEGDKSPYGEIIWNFTWGGGGIFLPGDGNLRSDFDNSNLFHQSSKHLSVNTEHQLKSKLTWPKCPKSMKLKKKWNRDNGYS